MASSSTEHLVRLIRDAPNQSLSFEDFMREALFNDECGYYRRQTKGIGRRGDFSTTATLSPVLGKALAAWATRHAKPISTLGAWHVIEVGAGSGDLARAFLKSLPWYRRPLVQYHIVEVSEPLRAQQKETLSDYRVTWHEDMRQAVAATNGETLIFHNELVDAFPVIRLYRHNDNWKEVHVTLDESGSGVIEEFVPEHNARLRDVHSTVMEGWDDPPPPEGQLCEVHASYYEWLAEWRPLWKAGRMLTIDYGDRLPGVYHRRPEGTIRAFWEHLHLTGRDIYARFGRQDLTADVNFSDLEHWGESLGLLNSSFQNQREFIHEWLPHVSNSEYRDHSLAFVLHPDGAGSAFKVLEQTVPDA